MKNWIVAVILLFLTPLISVSQNNNRTSAFNYHRNGKLDKAKEYIDKAAEHKETVNDAKTWFYRGNIYLDIARSKDEAFKNLDPDALNKSYLAYKRCMELDEKKAFLIDVMPRIVLCAEEFYNQGANQYNEKLYEKAVANFEKAFEVYKEGGTIDTASLYSAAIAAEEGNLLSKAKNSLFKLVELQYNNPDIYTKLSKIFLEAEKDTTKALAYIKEGKTRFPNSLNIAIGEINIYLATRQREKALEALKNALTQDTTNVSMVFAVGTIYDEIAMDVTITDKAFRELSLKKATESYKKAIALKPDFFDAIYNLGAIYVNTAVEIQTGANDLPMSEQKKYDELTKQADEYLNLALPYLEKAHEMQPEDLNTLLSLKDIYSRLKMNEKLKITNDKIAALKQ